MDAASEYGTPIFQPTPMTAARCATAAAGKTPVVVRTASKPHPLTPSRQVVLEEVEQVSVGGVLAACGSVS